MNFYLFPYGEVKPKAKIILFGMGKVGREYARQIIQTTYCDILFAVDASIKEGEADEYVYGEGKVSIFPVSHLNREGLVYDHIVISTHNMKFVSEIEDILQAYHVERSKTVKAGVVMEVEKDSYSQHGEDRIIYNALLHLGYFRDGKLPTYIDVGAHHPYAISNTALLYKMGCRGINIEANPELIKLFEEERPDDINLCIGVGAEEGSFPFYICNVSGLNTFKVDNIAFNEQLVEHDTGQKKSFPVEKIIDLPVRTLPSIIREYSDSVWPDYMSIDIEGMEYESLEVCDLSEGPKLISCEVNLNGDKFVEMFRDKGYFPYLWYRENIIFARNDTECLLHEHE